MATVTLACCSFL
jgi:hypothetical protein